jgi:hypothetical protein
MNSIRKLCVLFLTVGSSAALAQVPQVEPRIVTKAGLEGKVAVVEVAARFVTAIRLPEAVNSVVVGDPAQFQVEHSEREPRLVFVKALTTRPAETNLLISTAGGRQTSLLLVSRGEADPRAEVKVDFLVRYEPAGGFLIEPSGFPFALVGQTVPLVRGVTDSRRGIGGTQEFDAGEGLASARPVDPPRTGDDPLPAEGRSNGLDQLLEQQRHALLPLLYGERITQESSSGDRVRAGVSRVIDGGQQVAVLFSVVNPMKHDILLVPPQVQLGGRTSSGKVIRHSRWSTAEQLAVLDFRLSRRRLGPGERADGVVLFERPPYKQSNETLLLQVAEAGSVDRPALAPIGFGVSTSWEEQHGKGK